MNFVKRVIRRLLPIAKTDSPTRIQAILRRRERHYRPQDTKALKPAVLFESFQGKGICDSPLDIYLALKTQRPDLKFYWTIRKNRTKAPKGSLGLKHGSRDWLRALATSKYLVNNDNFPSYFRKVEGQVYLQTWHGTPLKRLGREIANNQFTRKYLDTMDRESLAWNYLISPNRYCTEVFPGAFSYSGRIIETGYPRNDRLVSPPEWARHRVRAALGITDPRIKLVLYAPTWREFKRTPTGKWETVNFMEQGIELPDGFHLMFRGHSNTHSAHNDSVAGGAIDVTRYPDVAELYLAADVLITDYSSVMFDFAITGKPILFLAPDLARYETERGFYFDFRADAPGPILNTSEEVVASLANLEHVTRTYAMKYAAWQQRFNSLEDGQATQRVIDIVFGRDGTIGNEPNNPNMRLGHSYRFGRAIARKLLKRIQRKIAKATKLVIDQTINIPRIVVVPTGDVTSGFNPFALDCSSVRLQPVSRELLIQHLRTAKQEFLQNVNEQSKEARPEDYLVRALIDFDDISYDDHADLLYDLCGQLVKHLRSYLSEGDTVNVLQYHQQQLAALIHSQMQLLLCREEDTRTWPQCALC